MDPYLALNINRNCTKEEIRKAFLKLAHIHHPDKGGDEKKFKEINTAYQWLQKNHGIQQFNPNINQGSQTTRYTSPDGYTVVYTTWNF